jgi:hypothetical protein
VRKLIVSTFLTLDQQAPGGEPGHPHTGGPRLHVAEEITFKHEEVLEAGPRWWAGPLRELRRRLVGTVGDGPDQHDAQARRLHDAAQPGVENTEVIRGSTRSTSSKETDGGPIPARQRPPSARTEHHLVDEYRR